MDRSGILVVDKPAGLTSHQVVSRARRVLGTRKIGHAGTLDPMATGVLILGVNRATRLLGHLALHDKQYLATIRLGQVTVTDDAEGETLSTDDASHLSDAQIEAAVAKLRGVINQVPSTVSAIKVDGKRAYALVRAGQDVQLASRQVEVTRFDLVERRAEGEFVDLDVVVDCASGTYVRALARDLGVDLGVGGHLTSLRRTRIGRYDLSMAVDLDDEQIPELMSMAEAARLSFPVMMVAGTIAREIGYGRPIETALTGLTGLIGPDGNLLALYEPAGSDGVAKPVAVLAPS